MKMAMTAENLVRRSSPDRIGRYHIVERIGRGAMGVVYRAHDEAMGRDVALKVLTPDLENDPAIRLRCYREAEAAALLSHPNIITIFDVGEDGDYFFIVMELLRGTTLKDLAVHEGPGRLERTLDLMIQLCAGLGAAHKASICHRDIKPGNLFVRSDGLLKILDFGVARLSSSAMTGRGFIVGTPDYMSPEQARGADIDGRSDIFSLGGVFYFMLTGRKPFPATELPILLHQIHNENPPALCESDAPPELAAVVMKALSKKRESRYQTCQQLMAELEVIRQRYRSKGEARAIPTAPVVATGPVSRSTADTVDFLPVGAIRGEDTVTIIPPSTWGRVRERIDSAVAVTIARLRRSAPGGHNQPNRGA